MFPLKTVFILGAGSSAEVGLPTGDKLKYKISEKIDIRFPDGYRMTSGDPKIFAAIKKRAQQHLSQDPNPYMEAGWKLRDALPLGFSIDNVLDAHRDDEKATFVGKLGIVSSILEAEQQSAINFNPIGKPREKIDFQNLEATWFAGITKNLVERVAKKDLDKIFHNVSFVNFNYDRCLEHYLFQSIKVYYGVSDQEVAEVMKTLRMFRPYGKVGKLPWQIGDFSTVEFGMENANLIQLSQEIKTFYESVHDTDEVSLIRAEIKSAQVVVFLGYAFHPQNQDLLFPQDESNWSRLYATAFEFSPSDRDAIHNDLSRRAQRSLPKGTTHIVDLKCGDLFREFQRSLNSVY